MVSDMRDYITRDRKEGSMKTKTCWTCGNPIEDPIVYAAPDMLEALKATIKVLKAIESNPAAALKLDVICDAIQITIDKAEGK